MASPGAPKGSMDPSARKAQGLSVRVVVRVRPITSTDASHDCTCLSVDPNGQHVSLSPPEAGRAGHKYSFDAALTDAATQEEVYEAAGVQQLVQAAAQGYHATVFAYGQTGSGKTYTMEGFRYSAPTAKGKAPAADFEHTPPQQLGITPRAVHALFAALSANTERRFSVRCSYVQIYKEQAYDLLNPTSIMMTPSGPQPQPSKQGPAQQQQQQQQQGLPGALRMRWNKTDDFYLENLFKVECSSADEALSLFRTGVSNKVMASHKLNAQSSRSHCLFTLYINSSPLASPAEVISSRLTLVDLAGSERGSTVGATEGKLRDESVAINKSLFTLRHVITCLASNAGKEATGAAAQASATLQPGATLGGTQAGAQSQAKLPPYRDSKLTSLLKNSLGGTAMTLMVACIAPVDTFYEENVSTLEYARQAARITNQVSVNEDTKTRLIRELRAEVAFLRQQLAAVQSPGALAASLGMTGLPGASPGSATQAGPVQGPVQGQGQGPARPSPLAGGAGHPGQSPRAGSGVPGSSPSFSSSPQQHLSVEELKARLLESAQHDVGVLVTKLLDAINLVQSLSTVNQQMRVAYDAVSKHSEELRIENDSLLIENAAVRDRLSFIEGVAGMSTGCKGVNSPGLLDEAGSGMGQGGGSAGGAAPPGAPAVYTAGAAALIELQELRRENALLRDRMAGGGLGEGGGAPPAGRSAGAPGGGLGPPGPGAGRFSKQRGVPGGAGGGSYPGSPSKAAAAAALTPFTPSVLRQAVSPGHAMPPAHPGAPPASYQGALAGGPPGPRGTLPQGAPAASRRASDPQRLPDAPALPAISTQGAGGQGGSPHQLHHHPHHRHHHHSPQQALVRSSLNLSGGALVADPPASPHAMARSLSVEGGMGAAGAKAGLGAGAGPGGQDWSGGGTSADDQAAKLTHLMSVRNAMARARMLADVPGSSSPLT